MTKPLDLPYDDYLHRVVKFYNISHLYTATQFKDYDDSYAGLEKLYSLHLGREDKYFPPVLICDVDGYVKSRRIDLSLVMVLDTPDIRHYVSGIPKKVRNAILNMVTQHGVYIPDEKDEIDLATLLSKSSAFLMPIPPLKNPEILFKVDWKTFIDSLASWDCEKDPRIHLIHKSKLMRGVEPRLNPHSIECTNGGTGKSIFYSKIGMCYGKVTPKSFLGYAKSPDEIYPGTIDGSESAIAIDQIESGGWQILRYLFNAMENGEDMVSSGAIDFLVKTKSSFAILANPLGYYTNPATSFARLLEHISHNPTIGRRFALIAYGRDFKVIEKKASYEVLDKWSKAITFFRAVEEYAKNDLHKIYYHPEIWKWVNEDIPNYDKRIIEITQIIPTDDKTETVRTFLREHGSAGQTRVKAAALNLSIVDNLDKIALQKYSIEKIIEDAEEYLDQITEINIESINNIVINLESEREVYAQNFFDSVPIYFRNIISAIELIRRSEDAKQTFYLKDINFTPEGKGYSHFSKCIEKLLDRKKLDDWNKKCQDNFRFEFKRVIDDFEVFLHDLGPCDFIDPIGELSQFSPLSRFHGSLTGNDSGYENDF